jgi:putative hydrolase of the HAD superfamily
VVESAKEGIRKPDPKAFELVLSRLELAPEEVVFLDDIGRNCKAASELGIHAIKVSL